MTLPLSSRCHFTSDLTICRILNGMWQVSGAHGPIDPERQSRKCSPITMPASPPGTSPTITAPPKISSASFGGSSPPRHGAERLAEIQAFTKWVPRPGRMTRRMVEEAIGVSLSRMGVDRLDLLQFHWWDYGDDRYLDALRHLADLQQRRQDPPSGADQFRHRASARHRRPRHPDRLEPGAVFADRPPARGRDGLVLPRSRHGAARLWHPARRAAIGEIPRPPGAAAGRAQHRQLQKYKQMIDAWGGWALFQELLPA